MTLKTANKIYESNVLNDGPSAESTTTTTLTSIIDTVTSPTSIAAHNGHLYWTEESRYLVTMVTSLELFIYHDNLRGTRQSFI